jgi:hypothetical protein
VNPNKIPNNTSSVNNGSSGLTNKANNQAKIDINALLEGGSLNSKSKPPVIQQIPHQHPPLIHNGLIHQNLHNAVNHFHHDIAQRAADLRNQLQRNQVLIDQLQRNRDLHEFQAQVANATARQMQQARKVTRRLKFLNVRK